MLGRTHLALALFISTFYFSHYSYGVMTDIVLLITFILGSIFPDIDTPKSLLGRKTPLIPYLFKHRGFFHSITAMIMISLILGLAIKPLVGIFFAAGFSSHLILDAISKEGIKVMGKKIKGPLKVGSLYEHILYLALLVLSLFFMF